MRECAICKVKAEKGWWGDPQIHHCRECHRSWSGTTQAHCVSCHHHFSTNSASDRHLVDGMCKPPSECFTTNGVPLLGLRTDKFGRTWSFVGDGTPWWLAQHEIADQREEGQVSTHPALPQSLADMP